MDYGFSHAGRVFTPNETTGITPEENTGRNAVIERAELDHWKTQPDVMLAYYDISKVKVTTWPGTMLGTITYSRVYRHNFGGRFVALRVHGNNGAEYYGRASYDWGQCVRLRKVKG